LMTLHHSLYFIPFINFLNFISDKFPKNIPKLCRFFLFYFSGFRLAL
jgi:hypothetical protein